MKGLIRGLGKFAIPISNPGRPLVEYALHINYVNRKIIINNLFCTRELSQMPRDPSPMPVAAAAAAENNRSKPVTRPLGPFRTKSFERMMLNTRDTPKTPNSPPMPIIVTSNRAGGGPTMASRTRQVLGERDSVDTSSFKTTSSDPLPESEGERSGSGRVRPSARPRNGSEVLAARYKKGWCMLA